MLGTGLRGAQYVYRTFTFTFIPEQFTVKAHPALFEGEGGGGGGATKK